MPRPYHLSLTGLFAALLLAASLAPPLTAVEQRFREADGHVVMEAENATEVVGWVADEGYASSGVTMRDDASRNDGYLRFSIDFTRTGRYFVWFRMRKPDGATDGSNDCFAYFNGVRPLSG